jgi:CheY-like chemotaxis protein
MPAVLIVDDVQLFSDVVGGALRRAGYEVLGARNGREAVDVVRRRRPSLVLLDLAMPVMGGIEALQIIRADPDIKVSGVPVLVVSASSDNARLSEAARLGAHGHMLKSRFSLVELLEAVRGLAPLGPLPEPQ